MKDSCSDNCRGNKSVILTQRVHPFPFRTRKLSSAVPKILIWRRIGKIGHCRHIIRETPKCFPCNHSTQYSSLAQSVEHLTVNQVVAGSSPAGGANKKHIASRCAFCYPSRRLGISSRACVYIIAEGVSHLRRCITTAA